MWLTALCALVLNTILNILLVQPCEIKPCKNNGICVNEEEGRFTCKCREGYGGIFCDMRGEFASVGQCVVFVQHLHSITPGA
jgi:predicted acyl esterase